MHEGDFFTPRSFENPPNNDAMPFSAWLVAGFWSVFGFSEWAARLPFLIFGILTVYLVYHIGSLLYNKRIGLYASFFLAVSPMHVYFSRNVQVESLLLFLMVISVYFFLKWSTTNTATYFYYSIIFLSLAILSKFIALFLLFPYISYIVIKRKNLDLKKIIFSIFIVFLPFAFWLVHVSKFPGTVWGESSFVTISYLISTYPYLIELGMLVGGLGLLSSAFIISFFLFFSDKKGNFPLLWFFGGVLYIFGVLPMAVKNNYYLMPLLPPLSLLAALGLNGILLKIKSVNVVLALLLVLLATLPTIYILYSIQHPYYEAGIYLKDHTEQNETIGWTESPAICFYAKRICVGESINMFEENRVRYFAVTDNYFQYLEPDFKKYLEENYSIEAIIHGKRNLIGKDFVLKKEPENILIYRKMVRT